MLYIALYLHPLHKFLQAFPLHHRVAIACSEVANRPIYLGEELLLAHQRVVFGEGDELEGTEVTRLDDDLRAQGLAQIFAHLRAEVPTAYYFHTCLLML